MFSLDETVVPKESAWFGSYAPSEPDSANAARHREVVPMKLQPTYLADTFGLQTLDKLGRISLQICEGVHMEITRDCWEPLVRQYVGGKLE